MPRTEAFLEFLRNIQTFDYVRYSKCIYYAVHTCDKTLSRYSRYNDQIYQQADFHFNILTKFLPNMSRKIKEVRLDIIFME